MEEKKRQLHIPLRLCLTAATVLLAAVCAHAVHGRAQAKLLLYALIIGAVLSLLLPWIFPGRKRGALRIAAASLAALALLLPTAAGIFCHAAETWEEKNLSLPEARRGALFENRRVLILAPHEDDEVLLAGGVIEEYLSSGSEVEIVFATNGEHFGEGETRLREALRAADYYGIPADHVIFLGYGDGWREPGGLYLAEDNAPLTSSAGYTSAWALPEHPAYREGESYTRSNFCASLRDILLTYAPDTVLCVDADPETEHRALSFLFEEVMGGILKEKTDYHPLIFKGFTYNSGWATGEKATLAIPATPAEGSRPADHGQYRNAEAYRFPVSGESVSLFFPEKTSVGEALSCYPSQNAALRADRVMRSDRLYFLRRTDSLLYGAEIASEQGDPAELNDFRLGDIRSDGKLLGTILSDNGWHFDPNGGEASFTVTLPEETEVGSLVLYDDPRSESNVLSLRAEFSDGTVLTMDAPDALGAATEYTLTEPVRTESITVTVTAWEGETPGLAEIEAYAPGAGVLLPLAKLTDSEGNYAYKLLLPESGEAMLYLTAQDTEAGSFRVAAEGEITLTAENGGWCVRCREGQSGRVLLLRQNGEVIDAVSVCHPGNGLRRALALTPLTRELRWEYQWEYYRAMVQTLLRGNRI